MTPHLSRKMKTTDLTLFILAVNAAIDTGKHTHISVAEMSRQIEQKSVFEFLAAANVRIEPSVREDVQRELSEALYDLHNVGAGNEGRKWGVRNSGLCLLLAWTNELIQSRAMSRES